MKKLTIILALAVAALATAGMAKHPSNPLTMAGQKVPTASGEWPIPTCPPDCDFSKPTVEK
jgi:hypothetical protein